MAAKKHFISDNASGVHPEVFEALLRANEGHAIAYGNDGWTARAKEVLRGHFGERCEILFALTGTGANVLALNSLLQSWQAIVCADSSHLERDECGAAEKFIGCKVLTVHSHAGKLTPESIEPILEDTSMVHRAQPRVVTVSQCTEWGTVYTPTELIALSEFCHTHGLLLHVDGARLCNAAAALDTSLAALTADCGVDVLSFGGTKNGLMAAEAVVFFDPALAQSAAFYRKQAMQLASKMRFVAAQFEALFGGDLWRHNASHSNAMATQLAAGIEDIDAVEIVMPVESNAVFARVPQHSIAPLQEHSAFAVWRSAQSIVRWMTSFDTTAVDVDAFVQEVRRVIGDGKRKERSS
ncbi:MAG: beta-eliminating lyase-related protein [Woeseiaceae bacterium]